MAEALNDAYSTAFIRSWSPPVSRKFPLIYHLNFDYCQQTKEKKNKNNKKPLNCDKQLLFSCFRIFGILA